MTTQSLKNMHTTGKQKCNSLF